MAKWNYVKIGDVCTVERGGSPRPIDKFITDNPQGINWIKIGDTTDSMYITETAQKMIFSFSIDSVFFMQIAKLRAARKLWYAIGKAFGQENALKMDIHAQTEINTEKKAIHTIS